MFNPIGIIHSPHKKPEGSPVQSAAAGEFQGRVELLPEYRDGLDDLDGFERIILLYLFHLSEGFSLHVKPFLDTHERGLFSTRAPKRPNPIGLSIVTVLSVENNNIHVGNLDVVDQTPLLDIKPYVPAFDSFPESTAGWFDRQDSDLSAVKADNRFI